MTIRDFVNNVRVELDPNQLESGFRQLQERVQRAASDGVHTKVRLKLNGKQLGPDIPLAAFLAAEAATFFYGGLLRALAVNLGMRSFLEIEFVHSCEEKVNQGRQFYADGELEAAEQCYREALRLRPDDARACYHLGVMLRVSGRLEEAVEMLEIAAADDDFSDQQKAVDLLTRIRNPGTIRTI